MSRTVVVGAGIAGLALAHALRRGGDADVLVLEAAPRPGGRIQSPRVGGFVCEAGPTGFLDNEPATLELVEELDLGGRLLRSDDSARRRFLLRGGEFHELHTNPLRFLRSPLLSRRGKLRMLMEPLVRAKRSGEESVGGFARRRLGGEVADYLVDPMVSGVFAGDLDRLSLPAAFPKMVEMEREHGGLFKAMKARRKQIAARAQEQGTEKAGPAGPGGVLYSFDEGMQVLVDALARELGPSLRCGEAVRELAAEPGGGWRLGLDGGPVMAGRVVLALPAPASAALLRPLSPVAAGALSQVPFSPVHVVMQAYRREQVSHDLQGFGFLVPRKEGRRILGTLFHSSIFPAHTADGAVLLRTMVGGARNPQARELDEVALGALVREETGGLLGISGEPLLQQVVRWPAGIPHYELGHLDRVEVARAALDELGGLELAGNSVAGIGVNHCIRHARDLAAELLAGGGDAREAKA